MIKEQVFEELSNDLVSAARYASKLFIYRIFYNRLYIITNNVRKDISRRITSGIGKKEFTRECGLMEVTFFKQRAIEQMLYCAIRRIVTCLLSYTFSYLITIIKIGRVESFAFSIAFALVFRALSFFVMVTKSGVFVLLKYQYCYGSTFVALKKTYKISLEVFLKFIISY